MGTQDQSQGIVVVGRSCRLPGAPTVEALWSNLVEARCSVSAVPGDRWSLEKHGHPRPKEPGKAYVWAAGVLDDVWGFDPAAFGISPREAEQMDPHQRLMLELTWEALEDAGITRSSVSGTNVGVYVGASSTEYQNIRNSDLASGDAYTATGGALSIISNRISHAFDFRGPSFTVDTACSSSLVALHQAMEAIRAGRIDTAIVGGVNLLLSPFGFVVFSQASMLSPTGLCRTFDASADGYVRAEGGVVLVLVSAARAAETNARSYARLVASGVNSDGRTNGIALPSKFAQRDLLRQVYAEAGIKPSEVTFVEAHGTGTRVGDPIEAETIGDVLGRDRRETLRIGSIKSNIGHLEPASGLAGVLKATLALEHDLLPPSLHFETPNPDIAFDDLKLEVVTRPTALPRGSQPRYAGINSFGFGGTNAHVILTDPPARPARAKRLNGSRTSDLFVVSAAAKGVVRDLARRYSEDLAAASPEETQEVVAAAVHRRELMSERAVIEWSSSRDLVRKLERIADREEDVAGVTWGTIAEANAPVAFVFSGNGGQWPGMGRGAYGSNRRFRETFDEIDARFDKDFGWSITEALFADDLDQRLGMTSVAQPLIFAIQIATARALAAEGVEPAMVIGHSVGEIATAMIAGALSLKDAVHVIHARSAHQEVIRDTGRMAVVVSSREQVEGLCEEVGELAVAAYNSPRTFTVAGPIERVAALGALARKRRIVFRQLDLAYPFHCALIDPVKAPLLEDLKALKAQTPKIPMISTVTGDFVKGNTLGAHYWWRNVREPVRFSAALETAARAGARVFVEISPRSVLLSNIGETLEPTSVPFATLGVLERREKDDDKDPIRPAAISAFVRGGAIDAEKLFGPAPSRHVTLPIYPWARRDIRSTDTPETVASTTDTRWHRLLGSRHTQDGTEWYGALDTTAQPELADHDVGGQPILPGAAFLEMALSAARHWFGHDRGAVLELDIVQPLVLEADRAKEIKTRLSPNTQVLEILSRPRLSRGGWHLHAIARLTESGEEPVAGELPVESGPAFAADDIYRAAEAVGLRYGPKFRLLAAGSRPNPRQILVDLAPSEPASAYALDPARLDACFHGLFVLFADLGAADRGTAYIPVRFGHTRLAEPGAAPARALIEITQAGERAITADFTLFDADGRAIAHLHDARFQAARVKRPNILAERALEFDTVAIDRGALGAPGIGTSAEDAMAAAAALDLVVAEDETDTPEQFLLEGWASATALRIAGLCGTDGVVPADLSGSLPEPTASWVAKLLHGLEEADLAERSEEGWRLADAGALPRPDLVLRTLAADHPDRSAELLLASAFVPGEPGSDLAADLGRLTPGTTTLDGFDLSGAAVRAAGEALARIVVEAKLLRPDRGGLRILQVGYGPLSHALIDLAAANDASLTILETDLRRLERGKIALAHGAAIAFVEAGAALPEGGFDLALSAEGLHRLGATASLPDIRRSLADGALLVAVEPRPSLFRDLVHGHAAGWFDAGSAPGFPLSPLASAAEWAATLEGAGFEAVATRQISTGPEIAQLLVGALPARAAEPLARAVLVRPLAAAASDLAERLHERLAESGHDVQRLDAMAPLDDAPRSFDATIAVVAFGKGRDDVAELTEACLALKDAAEAAAQSKQELWVVIQSAQGNDVLADPRTVGMLSFARTLANESSGLTIRRVCVGAAVDAASAAGSLGVLLARPQAETDILIDGTGPRALRVVPLESRRPTGAAVASAARLERGTGGGLGGLGWRGAERAEPKADEVEIAVEATALNFRDVMWAMSLLPDDILEDGFAGPTLGLECAGRVARVGAGVTHVREGDRVLSFAPSAFTTSVAVPAKVVAPLPAGWTTEAGASVPVAFLTAYYGLVTLAGMKAGDWVLIHGGAGGVGLAAIQIAQWRGATVVATAGSTEKRNLLRTLGVKHVLNSRSAAFADDIRKIRPGGVDIVLNSLSGEAMERGLSTLRAFGRFVELGKRDYVANTRIGLRPFRRNLSYFGVDVDQLLSDRDRASDIFGEVMALFHSGDLRPLPYRVYAATETVDAFRLMQQSGHIGKIVLRPPTDPVPVSQAATFRFDPEKAHLITGGFGGFGLEAARWLADQGGRHIVLVGRSGPKSEDAQALVAELVARGVNVRALACDVGDERAVKALLKSIAADMPPLGGIMHAAMVLEDALISGLTAEQLGNVLTPKVAGAALLDRLTAKLPLDYFVMFSSITTFIGNPGQGSYVAANGYLEGLARLRRERGQKALALAWGAISDVGVLARSKGLAESLSKRVGVRAMPAREALDLMAQALGETQNDPDRAVLAVGSLDWGAARRLPALASPTFAALTRDGSVVDQADRRSLDLKALVASGEAEGVRKQVIEVIVEEIASVLRVPKQDVVVTKKLAEIGLDSLMAIELASALQDRFELEAPPTGSVGALTTAGLADHLISFVQSGTPDEEVRVTQALNERHAGVEIAEETLAPVMEAVNERARQLKGLVT